MPLASFLSPPNDFQYHNFVDEKNCFIDVFEEVEVHWKGDAPFAQFMRTNACWVVEIVDQYATYGAFPQYDAEQLMALLYEDGIQWSALKKLCHESLDKRSS
jgi:hypothetical protein